MGSSFSAHYLQEVAQLAAAIDPEQIERLARELATVREVKGRLFFLGVGGGAGHASHAVNDFRKLAGFEAYAPTDNVSELTARINDDGWEDSFRAWLAQSHLSSRDALFVFSVGGGNPARNVSMNIVRALEYGRSAGSRIFAIVGRDDGYAAQVADLCVVIPTINAELVTPHTEGYQAVIWHLLVSHPRLKLGQTKW